MLPVNRTKQALPTVPQSCLVTLFSSNFTLEKGGTLSNQRRNNKIKILIKLQKGVFLS